MTGQVTRRWRSTRIPEHSGSPDGRGCSTAPEVWAEEAGTDRNPCPNSLLALCTNLAPTPLQVKPCISSTHLSVWSKSFQSFQNTRNNSCLPFLMTIFIILMAPPLARARNSFSSGVAKVTRHKAETKLRMGGWKQARHSWLGKNLRLHFREKIWSTARESHHHPEGLRWGTHAAKSHYVLEIKQPHLLAVIKPMNGSLVLKTRFRYLLHSILLSPWLPNTAVS